LIGKEGGIKKAPKLWNYNTKSFEEKTSGTIKKKSSDASVFFLPSRCEKRNGVATIFSNFLRRERKRCCKRWRGGVSRPQTNERGTVSVSIGRRKFHEQGGLDGGRAYVAHCSVNYPRQEIIIHFNKIKKSFFNFIQVI
jgi:hypothetical protein